MRDRDVCPEMLEHLEWPGQHEQEPWNSPKWRQRALHGNRVVANVHEAQEVASAALAVFAKVLNEVRQCFQFGLQICRCLEFILRTCKHLGSHPVFVYS